VTSAPPRPRAPSLTTGRPAPPRRARLATFDQALWGTRRAAAIWRRQKIPLLRAALAMAVATAEVTLFWSIFRQRFLFGVLSLHLLASLIAAFHHGALDPVRLAARDVVHGGRPGAVAQLAQTFFMGIVQSVAVLVVIAVGTVTVVAEDVGRAGVWTVAATAAVAIALRLVLDVAITTAFAPLSSTRRVRRPVWAILALGPLEVLGIVLLWDALPFFAYFVVHAGVGFVAAALQVRALRRQLRDRDARALYAVRRGFSGRTLVRSAAYAVAQLVMRGDAFVVSLLLWAALQARDVEQAARIAVFSPVLLVATAATRGFAVDLARCFDSPSTVLRTRGLRVLPVVLIGATACAIVLAIVAVAIAGLGPLSSTLLSALVLAATALWSQALVLDRRPAAAVLVGVVGAAALLLVLAGDARVGGLGAGGGAVAFVALLSWASVAHLRNPRERAGLFADPTTLRARAGTSGRFLAFRVVAAPSVPRTRIRKALQDALGPRLRGACFTDACTVVAVVVDVPWPAPAPPLEVVRPFGGLLTAVWEHGPLADHEPPSSTTLTAAEARRRSRLAHAVATGDAVFPAPQASPVPP
jgi:hypothetical protein